MRGTMDRGKTSGKKKGSIYSGWMAGVLLLTVAGALLAGCGAENGSRKGPESPETQVGVSEEAAVSIGGAEPESAGQEGAEPETLGEPEEKIAGDMTVSPMDAVMYTRTNLNIRSEASAETEKLGMFGAYEAVHITGDCGNGWYQIVYDGQTGYVMGDYLVESLEELRAKQSAAEEFMASLPAGTVISGDELDLNMLKDYFCVYEISEDVFRRIDGKSYRENADVSLADLRYMKVLHYNFDHEVQIGEAIVAASLTEDYTNIFYELFLEEYEIYSMYLVDDFWTGDATTTDSASIDKNNSSAFCYRPATNSSKLSKHSYGRAIDINPQQNPYVSFPGGEPKWAHENANDYIDRSAGYDHMIDYDDACYQIFHKYGFTWGGDYKNVKDYQHFQK